MKIINLIENNFSKIIYQTIEVLANGGLVVFPSDTVYGLLVDATNEMAVKKLITFKNRPAGKPISVFCNFELINQLVTIDNQQSTTLKQILPGPFTIILPSKHKVSKLLESEAGTLGIRIPSYQLINRLIQKFGKPVTATSANLAGRSPHYSIDSLFNQILDKQKQLVDLVIDVGTLSKNKPSTVVDLSQSDVKILRQGDKDFSKKSQIFLSKTSEETKNIAGRIFKKNFKKNNKPLIFIIEGEMGVGKTIFVKGIGEQLGINNIVSPTFVIYYEYDNFYHFDLYNIESNEEFKHLGIEKFLKPGNILCFEWGEKAGEIADLLKSKGKIVYVKMEYIDKRTRKIITNNQ